MWRIEYKGLTLQEVLIMAYMNILDKLSPAPGFVRILHT